MKMDKRYRVYYLLNLNQNYKKAGWWSKDWDNYGVIYNHNLSALKSNVDSLKITFNYKTTLSGYHQMKISCKKDDEKNLLSILNTFKDIEYIKC